MFGTRGTAVTLGSLALVLSSLVWAPDSQARPREQGAVTCTGNSVSRYDPPLTLTPQPTRVHAEVRYDSCTAHAGHTFAATSTFESLRTAASCVSDSDALGVETVRYADGGRSVIAIESATTVRDMGVLFTLQSGRVTEGRGAGHQVRRTVAAPPRQLPTDCLTSGIGGSNSGVQLEILP
ncbi:hypothetical protein LKL35_16030 [Streptomyces sp. ET3-23]|uniref:hypothetical protein n=1 Tax=Streptomyces sp. ET3-23 TaxID=2885643 RepID=UPI001D1141E9|nr:hypothetical protein [Streptomyces sp. ET3-23]MCC2276909.1 hypothetical protein [Streptomyces sp. ET3-23]